ncbi:nitrate- and nitrite sensing domain-containing protein [Kitasatospora sp. NPDC096147]|uniref:sensor histidine kinase n=1 Tax=Kitasatospora sp. NPDC096147 TaxID=3364093 RepID=UPI0037F54AD9
MAGPHQAAPLTGPGEQIAGGGEPEPQDGADGTDQNEKPSGRSRLRTSLTRRRATGLSRFAMRNWKIRTRLIALLLLPVVVALALGGLRVQSSMENSRQLSQMANLADLARTATDLANALQSERDLSAGPLTTGGPERAKDDDVANARKVSDQLSKAFAASADNFDDLDLAGGKALLLQVRRDLNQLSEARSNAYVDHKNIQATITNYDVIIKNLLSITQDIAIASNSTELVKITRGLYQFSLAKENTSMQRALISAALANPGGPDLSSSDETFGIRLKTSEDNALTNFNAIYGDTEAQALRRGLTRDQEIANADRYSKAVLNPNGIKQTEARTYKDWYDSATVKITNEQKIEKKLLEDLDGRAGALQDEADTQALVNGGLIALVLIVAIAGAALVARSMVRSLTRLQVAAEDVAERRLPELVKTLSESDPHDVDVTVEPVGVDSADEIGHVAHAFDMVHREAVRLAAEQALLRGNINAMFTNLSRRSQGLIQRQLSLISELESREADPDQLASLFKLDHLATRMRRNGENLLVLAGEDPGRRWTRPVPLVDVLRAAASEVEQYERIELASVPSAEVAGRVVNDLVHLLAELLENATSFSSPQTRVRVTGHALPDGRVLIEIHDTGIGLSPDDLADINERLANPPVVDVSVSRRMGLFVVGRLSLRHGIRIQLRPSDSGGTTALVMLPLDVTTSADRRAAGRPGGPGKTPQRGVGPTPRQQGRGSTAEALAGRGAAALGQGPQAPQGRPGGAPGSRPQLGQGPQGGGRPGAPAGAPGGSPNLFGGPAAGAPAGGLPTRDAGQSLRDGGQPGRENPAEGLMPRRTPGASGAPGAGAPGQGAPGLGAPGAGLPRRGPGQGPGQPQGQQPGRPQPGFGQERQRPEPASQGAEGWGEQPQHGRAGQPEAGRRPQPQGRPQAPAPQQAPAQPQFQQQAPAPLEAAAESTAQFSRPRFEASEIDPRDPLGLGLVEPVLPSVPNPVPQQQSFQQPFQQQPQQQAPQQGQPMALPTGPGLDDTVQWQRPQDGFGAPAPQRTPRQQPAPGAELPARGLPEATGDPQARPRPSYQPQRPGTSAPGLGEQPRPAQRMQAPAAQPQAQQAQQAPTRPQAPAQQPPQPQSDGRPQPGQDGPGPGDAPWRPSANDERWRRAEQVREPSSDGLTLSGLPRRTPQANLVSGTAEASPLTGPQVSRSPEEVRGRLTNLRRGIQQGRQAGAEAASQGGGMPTRPPRFDGFGPQGGGAQDNPGYGSNQQER